MLNQTLKVVPHGLIESGQVVINADEKTGLIDVAVAIVAGWGPFTQNEDDQEELKLDPSTLLSANVKPGMKMAIGPVTIEILSSKQAKVTYVKGDDQATGTVDIDLSGQYLKISHVNATGTISGQSVQLELQA